MVRNIPLESSGFDAAEKRQWFLAHWHWSLVISAVYLLSIRYGQRVMRKRDGFSLKNPLIAWNTALAIFSIFGSLNVVPELVQIVFNDGIRASYCSFGNNSDGTAYWSWLLIISKLPELLDTAFLVLRKRPVIFLHVYHHVTVFVMSWFGYRTEESSMRWGIAMNFLVHAVMYSYYALRAAGFRLPRYVAMTVTTLQIAQMIAGTCISVIVFAETYFGNAQSCPHNRKSVTVQLVIYTSYLVLFVSFFQKNYFAKKPMVKKEA